MELPRDGVEEHAVDGEVAALGVEFRGRKRDGLGPPAIDVDAIRAERGHLDREVLSIVAARADHFDDAERGTDRNGTAEQVRDLLRPGVGGNVVVVGREAEEFVAHAAAGPQRPEPGLLQRANHLGREFAFGHGLGRRPSSKAVKISASGNAKPARTAPPSSVFTSVSCVKITGSR